MANWTKNPPSGSSTRRKWNLEDRASLNNLKYHIAAEGCSEVQYDLARQLLDKTIEQNETTSSQQAIHWLLRAAQQGHEASAKLLLQCYEDGCGINADNESEVRCCLSMTPGERAARKAARELFACLANGGEHISPKQLERKMREIYKMQKRRRRRGDSTSTSEEEESDENDRQRAARPLEDVPGDAAKVLGNGHVNRRRRTRLHARLNLDAEAEQRLITEENLVSAAVNYAAGRMPAVNDALTLSAPHPASLDHVPCFHRLLFHPIIFLTLLYHRLINCVSALPGAVPPSVRLAALFTAYWLASSENLTVFLPIGFYYLCLGVMVWSTCKMLKTKQDFIDFRIWSGLFLSYGDNNIEAGNSENRFLKNNMKPYLYFFGAFVGNLIAYPLIAVEWLPHSELTIVACVFVFVTLAAFMYSSSVRRFPDWVVLTSFGVNVLAKYPYEMDEVVTTGWRFLDLKVPTFCSFVIGNGIEFCLNCRTALYLLIPGFLVHLAKRSHWHGTYTHLIPHCVTLSWLQLCITASQSATMFGVVRATLGLAGVLLFLPLFGIVSLLVPVFVAIEWMGFTDPGIRLGTTVAAAILALLGSCFLAVNRTMQRYITALQVLVCIIAACVLTFPYMTSNFKDTTRFGFGANIIETSTNDQHHHHHNTPIMPSTRVHRGGPPSSNENEHRHSSSVHQSPSENHHQLSWHRFHGLCGQPAWDQNHNNRIKAQLRCSHLDGMSVSWEGAVAQVQIARVSNQRAAYIAKYLPRWLANLVRCIWGERASVQLGDECDSLPTSDPLCAELKRILKSSFLEGSCSLHRWNSYEYEIRVRMSSGLLSKGADVVLQAGHKFGNFTRRLAAGDRVHFYGTLYNSRVLPPPPSQANGRGVDEREDFVLGASHAHVQLVAVECVQCQDRALPPVSTERAVKSSPVDARMRDLTRGIKYLLNVLLNPLITFK